MASTSSVFKVFISVLKRQCIVFTLLLLLSASTIAADPYAGFPNAEKDFTAHINAVEQYLLKTQMHQRSDSDVRFNLPFELKAKSDIPYRGKFMLFHGLNDSPFVMTDVATELTKRGFDVRAILLPGHGNTPRAQLNMSYTRWIKAAREHLNYWHDDKNIPMYLAGFSLGGVLATLLSIERDDIAGLLLFSPAYKSSMDHLLRWSGIYSVFKPWIFGGMIIEDNPTKYNSIPVNGASQYYKTARYLQRIWRGVKSSLPVLVIASRNDSVVNIDYMLNVFNTKFTAKNKRFILYSNIAEGELGTGVDVRRSQYPDLRILNQSHQSTMLSPQNPLFGVNGKQLVCNGNDWPIFSACLYYRGEHWYGAQHTESPDGIPVARTTYNPDFSGVFEVFDELFLE